jgi:hypothetical protein
MCNHLGEISEAALRQAVQDSNSQLCGGTPVFRPRPRCGRSVAVAGSTGHGMLVRLEWTWHVGPARLDMACWWSRRAIHNGADSNGHGMLVRQLSIFFGFSCGLLLAAASIVLHGRHRVGLAVDAFGSHSGTHSELWLSFKRLECCSGCVSQGQRAAFASILKYGVESSGNLEAGCHRLAPVRCRRQACQQISQPTSLWICTMANSLFIWL